MPKHKSLRGLFSRPELSFCILIIFFVNGVDPIPQAQAGQVVVPVFPAPGTMIALTPAYIPAHLMGMTIDPHNTLKFDFLIHKGEGDLSLAQKKQEYTKLVKYFLASLTIPDKDQWVNLSPYEHNRIITANFGKTEMGRDLLGQDYLLKQLTSSLMYPESGFGKKFWDKVYKEGFAQYGNTNIPVNTFNKVWIVPDQSVVYEKGNTAYIIKTHLKLMLEEDYLALYKNNVVVGSKPTKERAGYEPAPTQINQLGSKVIRQIILPALEKEVNEGKNFAQLRQIVSGMILATWYKKALKESLLGEIFADKAKVKGVGNLSSPSVLIGDPQYIYQQYLKAFKKGVYNYIKEDEDKFTHQSIPRKYFAGGFDRAEISIIKDSLPSGLKTEARKFWTPGSIDKATVNLDSATITDVFPGHKFIDKNPDPTKRKIAYVNSVRPQLGNRTVLEVTFSWNMMILTLTKEQFLREFTFATPEEIASRTGPPRMRRKTDRAMLIGDGLGKEISEIRTEAFPRPSDLDHFADYLYRESSRPLSAGQYSIVFSPQPGQFLNDLPYIWEILNAVSTASNGRIILEKIESVSSITDEPEITAFRISAKGRIPRVRQGYLKAYLNYLSEVLLDLNDQYFIESSNDMELTKIKDVLLSNPEITKELLEFCTKPGEFIYDQHRPYTTMERRLAWDMMIDVATHLQSVSHGGLIFAYHYHPAGLNRFITFTVQNSDDDSFNEGYLQAYLDSLADYVKKMLIRSMADQLRETRREIDANSDVMTGWVTQIRKDIQTKLKRAKAGEFEFSFKTGDRKCDDVLNRRMAQVLNLIFFADYRSLSSSPKYFLKAPEHLGDGITFTFWPVTLFTLPVLNNLIGDLIKPSPAHMVPITKMSDRNRNMTKFNGPGGIDLTHPDLLIKRDGQGVPLLLGEQDRAQLNDIEGFYPTILSIESVKDIPILEELNVRSSP